MAYNRSNEADHVLTRKNVQKEWANETTYGRERPEKNF